jgi:hypothetical protein
VLCKQLKAMSTATACVRCQSQSEVRYGKCPEWCPDPTFKKGLMCGKCASYLGMELSDWVYPDSSSQPKQPNKTFERVCAQCKAEECALKCPECDRVSYCTRTCQDAHRPKHKAKCKILQGTRTSTDD